MEPIVSPQSANGLSLREPAGTLPRVQRVRPVGVLSVRWRAASEVTILVLRTEKYKSFGHTSGTGQSFVSLLWLCSEGAQDSISCVLMGSLCLLAINKGVQVGSVD